mmetsp:Transcript_21299/g.46368  ORF Transcript_21299/g.46368 Transcript_21299/m.46368 type:complete len:136 (+) Transcript_21299:1447-1854(+)
MASCHMRLKEWEKVLYHCDKVLEHDKENVKALCRRASANMELKNLELARMDLEKATSLDPENSLVRTASATLSGLERKDKKRQQQVWGGKLSAAIDAEAAAAREAEERREQNRQAARQQEGTGLMSRLWSSVWGR